MEPISSLIPYTTVKVPPPPGPLLAWCECIKDYVPADATQVMQKPRLYPFWLPERRKISRPT